MRNLFIAFAAILFLASCWNTKKEEVLGYAPIYGDSTQLKKIELSTPKPYETAGKIYVYGNTLYQVETGKGIHITDISNPLVPVKTGFISVMGAQEIAVKDNAIYTNNMKDLVILRISGNTVTLTKRLPGSFKNLFDHRRPPERGRFECPNPTKGIVIGWQKKTIINPNCSY
ncbi:MAG TPA: hypothetical protein PK110_01360 [Niabella sp.]|jgi:hypothetical protein|nr:hypothetical protein [Niabella sp.]HRO83446.1 hypothetical protein [Niabella sp.]